jgi:2-keto-4-pentenoate hydratase
VQALAGDRPVIGYLDARTLVQDGGEWSRREGDVRAETEFGVVLRSDVAAGTRASDAAAAIAGLCVALEIVDLDRSPGDIDAVMRGNVFHRAVAFGPTRPVALEHVGSASLHLDDAIHEASEPMPDPIWVVHAVADAARQRRPSKTLGRVGISTRDPR